MGQENVRKKIFFGRLSRFEKTLLVFALSFTLTFAMVYAVRAVHYTYLSKFEKNITSTYENALRRKIDENLRSLRSVIPLLQFDNLETEELIQDALKKVYSSYTFNEHFSFIAYVPFNQDFTKTLPAKIITDEAWQREWVERFLKQVKPVWTDTALDEGTLPGNGEYILGVHYLKERGQSFLVIGLPFNSAAGRENSVIKQYPDAMILAWLDVSKILRQSWDHLRDPANFVYLKTKQSTSQNIYYAYQSGLISYIRSLDFSTLSHATSVQDFSILGHEFQIRIQYLDGISFDYITLAEKIILSIGSILSVVLTVLVFVKNHPEKKDIEVPDATLNSVNMLWRNKKEKGIDQLETWKGIVSHLPVSIFVINAKGKITFAEGRSLSLFEGDSIVAKGKSYHDFFKNYSDFIANIDEAFNGIERQEALQVKRHWLQVHFCPVLISDGVLDGVILAAVDITHQYHLKSEIDRANLHLAGLLDNVPAGVVFVREGVIQWCSRSFEEMLGYKEDALNGRSPEILYADNVRFHEIGQEARPKLKAQEIVEYKAYFRKEDGHRFRAEISGRCLDHNNYSAGTIWVIQDLTNLIEEERLKRLSQTVFDNVMEGVLVTNTDRQIIFINNAFRSITGYGFHEVEGQNPKILSSGKHDSQFFDELWESISLYDSWSGEIWNKRKNGELYLSWLTIKALKNSEDEIEEYVAVFSDITTQRNTQQQLAYKDHYDALTGLANKQLLQIRFNQTRIRALKEEQKFCLIFIGLDNFKFVNETYGHDTGDFVLKEVSQRFKKMIQPSDTLARISGDEFVLILNNVSDEKEISRFLASLAVELSIPIELGDNGDQISLSASSGVTLFPQDGEHLGELVRKADTALYHAKSLERGIFTIYKEEMGAQPKDRLHLENKMRMALANNEFVVHYQPKVNINTGALFGAEALVRWNDPNEGMVYPDKFIPLAEENGFIIHIGDWILEEVCKQIKKWREDGNILDCISVNLSGRQFSKPNLASDVLALIEKYEIPASSLELEITESFLATSENAMIETLGILSNNGVRLSLDDFGTGYSSLSYLDRLPLNIMKIDRSFISKIGKEDGERAEKLAKAIIAIAKSLNLEIVAEGVEDQVQLEFLKANDCHCMQGYFYSKPVSSSDFEKLLKERKNLYTDYYN